MEFSSARHLPFTDLDNTDVEINSNMSAMVKKEWMKSKEHPLLALIWLTQFRTVPFLSCDLSRCTLCCRKRMWERTRAQGTVHLALVSDNPRVNYCLIELFLPFGFHTFQQGVQMVGKGGRFICCIFLVAKPDCWPYICSSELPLHIHTHTHKLGFPLWIAEIPVLPGTRVSFT